MDETRIRFNEFAEKTLATHLEELNTQPAISNSSDPEHVDEAFKNRSLQFEKELDAGIDELLTEENMEHRTSLLEMKQAYLLKLKDAWAPVSIVPTESLQ